MKKLNFLLKDSTVFFTKKTLYCIKRFENWYIYIYINIYSNLRQFNKKYSYIWYLILVYLNIDLVFTVYKIWDKVKKLNIFSVIVYSV